MLHTTVNNPKNLLIEVEGTDIQSQNKNLGSRTNLYVVADIEDGKFRRLFNRHRRAYRLFN